MGIGFIIFFIIVAIVVWQTIINRHNNWKFIRGDDIPLWVQTLINKKSRYWNWNAQKYRGKYITLKGKHYRYKVNIDGQSADCFSVSRKLRRRFW